MIVVVWLFAVVMAIGCPPAAPLAMVIVVNAHLWRCRLSVVRAGRAQARAERLRR